MNEASSKFVDHIAVDKLLSEKLNKVNHYPDDTISGNEVDLKFIKDSYIDANIFSRRNFNGQDEIIFNSSVLTNYQENNTAKVLEFKTEVASQIGNLIFVHGLYEDNISIYKYFISLINELGINVYLFILPFHYNRKPKQSLFSGEYFWSGNINRSVLAFKQSVFDLYHFYLFIKEISENFTVLSGFSMGGGISLTLASLIKLDGLYAINPVSNITSLVWNSKLFSPVKKDFETAGLDFNSVKLRFREFEPIDCESMATPLDKIYIGYSLYDQINKIENYEMLIEKWKMKNIFKYKAGHLNVLRVPKLTNDIEKIFKS